MARRCANLDLAGLPVTGPPNRQLAADVMVGESDEVAFANVDKLDLNEEEAVQSRSWLMNPESTARIDNSPIASP